MVDTLISNFDHKTISFEYTILQVDELDYSLNSDQIHDRYGATE